MKKPSEMYAEISKQISTLIFELSSADKLSKKDGYYYLKAENYVDEHERLLDRVELIIHEVANLNAVSAELRDSWLWHFPIMLGSYNMFSAQVQHMLFSPVRLDLASMQFIAVVHVASVIGEDEWELDEIRSYYKECVVYLNNMLDFPYDTDFFDRHTNYFFSTKCQRGFEIFSSTINQYMKNVHLYKDEFEFNRGGFYWVYENNEIYKLSDFDTIGERYKELLEFFCTNRMYSATTHDYVHAYCYGDLTIGELQFVMQMTTMLAIIEYFRKVEGVFTGLGIGSLAAILRIITHGPLIKSSGFGVSTDVRLIMIDGFAIHAQPHKDVINYYAGILDYYRTSILGDVSEKDASYILDKYDELIDSLFGAENLLPPPKTPLSQKKKEIYRVFKSLDKEKMKLVNRLSFSGI